LGCSGEVRRFALLEEERGRIEHFEQPRVQQLQRERVMTLLYRVANNDFEDEKSRGVRTRKHHERHRKGVKARRPAMVYSGLPHNQFLRDVVEDRIKKWKDPSSHWYKIWSDRQRPVTWARRQILYPVGVL
jgi:hypothetical protein